MQIMNILKCKRISVTEIPKWTNYLRKQWEDHFANHMSLKEKKDIYLYDDDGICGFLWHLFSYEKRDCLKGKEAEQAFNSQMKDTCYVFYQHVDNALILEGAITLDVNDLLNESDVYIVDKEFTWTYVKTHETGLCGPYFCRRDTKHNCE